MRVEDLPDAKSIGTVAANREEILSVLRSNFPTGLERPLLYAACINNRKVSCNFYAERCLGDMINLVVPLRTLEEFAQNLLRITTDASFYKRFTRNPGGLKGWEIAIAEGIEGVGILATPTWVHSQ